MVPLWFDAPLASLSDLLVMLAGTVSVLVCRPDGCPLGRLNPSPAVLPSMSWGTATADPNY